MPKESKNIKSNKLIKVFTELSRLILGLTFMFSGFVKSIDPWGTAFKVEDYFVSFGLESFNSLSFVLASFLCIFEFVLGAFMLFGIYRVWTSRLILLVMLFMTPLTLYLAIANPVQDCGCFGDALQITNWQTFYKNIILIVCAFIVWKNAELIKNLFTGKSYWLVMFYIILFSILFVFRNYIYEPIVDFRPYSIGTNIEDKMVLSKDKQPQTEMNLVYEKDGVEKSFDESNYPWEDSTWVYVRTDIKIIKEGELPEIKDFAVQLLDFNNDATQILGDEDITNELLSDTNYSFIIVSPFLSKLNLDYISNLEDIAYYSKEYKYNCYFFTASTDQEILNFIKDKIVAFDFCKLDERVLKTISRTNPSLLLLKNGTIYNKWADIQLPNESELNKPLTELSIGQAVDAEKKQKQEIVFSALLFFVPLFLLKITDFLAFNKMKK